MRRRMIDSSQTPATSALKSAGRAMKRRLLTSRGIGVLLVCLLALPWPRASGAQAAAAASPYRHHVIFLVDTSGSVYRGQGLNNLKRLLNGELGSLLNNPRRHGFGDVKGGIYDPDQDLSTAMGFGLRRENPVFAPGFGDDGFLRVLWVQEQGRGYGDLADRLPRTSRYWTAFAAAFGSAVRQVKHEIDSRGLEPQAFERTFLVMVTDAETNTEKGSVGEIREIHAAALRERPLLGSGLHADRRDANAYFQRLTSFYSLWPPEKLDALTGATLGSGGRLKVFVRELKPQRLEAIDGLLAERPNRLTELRRRSDGRYEGRLSLVPKSFDSDPEGEQITYELLSVEYQEPGTQGFEEITDWGRTPDGRIRIDFPEILLPTGAMTNVATFRLSFVRRDPVYGESIQRFEDTIRFRPEPTEKILGLVPVFG